MDEMGKRQFVLRRGGVLHFRRKYPGDVVGKLYKGKKLGREFKKSLGTGDYKQLEASYELALIEFNQAVEIARGNLSFRKAARRAASRIRNASPLRPMDNLDDKAAVELLARWFSREFSQSSDRMPPEAIDEAIVDRSAEAAALLNPNDPGAEAYVQDLAEAELLRQGYKVERTHPNFHRIADIMARAEAYIADHDVASLERREISLPHDADIKSLLQIHRDRLNRTGGIERTFGELLDNYMKERAEESRSEKSRLTDEMLRRTLIEFMGADTLLADIDLNKCREFRNLVVRLPANWTKRYPNTPLHDIPARAELDGREPMSPKNVTKYIARLKAVFAHAKEVEGWIDRNPAAALKLKGKKAKTSTKYIPFGPDDLEAVFKAPIFIGCKDAGRGAMLPGAVVPNTTSRYWVPLIGLYTGMRQTEICQLHAADIRQVHGMWVISVTEDNLADERETTRKKLKTPDAKRDIPIHPELIRLGLVKLAAHRKQLGQTNLFSEFVPGKYADKFQKWFKRLLVRLEIKRPRLVFHSFRHGFRDALARAGVDAGKITALAGWRPLSGMVFHCGSGEFLKDLADAISKIDFGEVTLHLDGFTGDDE